MRPQAFPTSPAPTSPAPAWLLRLTAGSVGLAMLSFGALLWAKWGIVLSMTEDLLKYCFG